MGCLLNEKHIRSIIQKENLYVKRRIMKIINFRSDEYYYQNQYNHHQNKDEQ